MMFNSIKNILLLGIVVSTLAFSNAVWTLTTFVTDFNGNVIAFLPTELMVFVYVIAFLIMIKIYQSMKH